ncbi:DHS-like NAD/FAD-binding domain-containing protein [Mycena rebaudengoi]|nr:DHS-like NAD/FAD-binding domain-containing protein [Mycena rebaudengoi]
MTLFVPLDTSARAPTLPSFVKPAGNPTVQLERTIKAILKARNVVIVCGAGISVQAGIPDFRSPEGLFQTLKRDNPKEVLASGKDLFDASVFHSENTTSLFCQMIARLSELSNAAEPTPFHRLLRALDDRGKLLRVYTQNIDAIEEKSGLSFGVPEFEGKRSKPRTPKSKSKPSSPAAALSDPAPAPIENVASTSRLPTPPDEQSKITSPLPTPRCIPLHGTLQSMHCQICTHSFALADHLASLLLGTPPACPECTAMEETRQLVGKRARGVGRLRPSVVLYNEAHKDGEGVGEVVRSDLMGRSKGKSRAADLLLVVGTSLRVQGTKRMVREFAKSVRSRGKDGAGSNRPSPTPAGEEEPPVKAVYLNLDFPVPTREWEGVFDAWLQGDAQMFAQMLQTEIDSELLAKELASEKKRRKEELEVADCGKKRKHARESTGSPKRRKITIVSMPSTPPRSRQSPSASPTTSSGIFLRLPRLIPEVYITSTRPTSGSLGKPPPTPENSPPRPAKTLSSAKGGSRTAAATHKSQGPPSTPVKSRSPSSITGLLTPLAADAAAYTPDVDDELVRKLQNGLRSSRSSSRSRG